MAFLAGYFLVERPVPTDIRNAWASNRGTLAMGATGAEFSFAFVFVFFATARTEILPDVSPRGIDWPRPLRFDPGRCLTAGIS